ncbi:site-specific integrase [uncultured Modestobacter sp.]|uniref:tyrosine-type recombinase/integrase n=1 Tax=uncultured Modestobacter sp. TaxID=380048 RepID=UPI00262C8157|nr:site-specific integrase [uncultured Modestobacter sp.]
MSKSASPSGARTKKPPKQMPDGIVQRGDSYQVRWREPGIGQGRRQRARSFRDYWAALEFLHQTQGQLRTGAYVAERPEHVSFGEFFDRYIADRTDGLRPWKPNTLGLHQQTRGVLPRELLAKPLTAVTEADLSSWVAWLLRPVDQGGRGLAMSTTTRHLDRVRSVFALAERRRLITWNPAKGEDVRLARQGVRKVDREEIPTVEQVTALLAAFAEQHPAQAVVLALGALAGLRSGEARGLRIADVSELHREIRVTQQLVRVPGKVSEQIAPPKTDDSARIIPVDDGLIRMLVEHIAEHRADAAPGDLLVLGSNGWPMATSTLQAWWRSAYVAAGLPMVTEVRRGRELELPKFSFHDLRKFFTSALLEAGVDVLTVARRLGHTSPALIWSVYGQLFGDHAQRTRQAMAGHSAAVLPLRAGGAR